MSGHLIDILIPTFDNPRCLYPCVQSLLTHQTTAGIFEITVINNGQPDTVKALPDHVRKIQMDSNKGWCGGLNAGLKETSAPFVLLCNDDIFVPMSSRLWPNVLLQHFVYPDCAAVGPSSNYVMGQQQIWAATRDAVFRVPFLIGFFMLVRRSDLEQAGGIDESFTCGDDLDLSIRLRKLGKYLIADKQVFVYHHGAQTGPRVEGNYWYSADQQMRTWNMLFQKHGIKIVHEMLMQPDIKQADVSSFYPWEDVEAKEVAQNVEGEKVLEIACGSRKSVPHAIGVDLVKKDDTIPHLPNVAHSVADVQADVSKPLPFDPGGFDTVIARHILEHLPNSIDAIRNWSVMLKPNGRLIIAVPDQAKHSTIPMNLEHVHAFTKDSLRDLMSLIGFKEVSITDCTNNISIIGVFQKNGVH